MSNTFSTLETKILGAKGLTEDHMAALAAAGISSKEDLKIIGDAATLRELVPGVDSELAGRVMSWATGHVPQATGTATLPPSATMVLDTADVVYCSHCSAKQPKDYKSGDLCIACGRQAEPILTCFWCAASGPGAFCRNCGARFVSTAELDLALLLKHEGLPKDDVPRRLDSMTQPEKDLLWGRVRRFRA